MEYFDVPDYSLESYRKFLELKRLPMHRVEGERIWYENRSGIAGTESLDFNPLLFDYQKFIVALALAKKRFAVFADVGLGKSLIFLEWSRFLLEPIRPQKTLIISQLHLIRQTIEEQQKFYGESNIVDINSVFKGRIPDFLASDANIGIVNVDKFNKAYRLQDHVGAIILDESDCLANSTGKQKVNIVNSCKGIPYKLACTATPARNNRQEYASHCLFLEYIDNEKQFFTKYFYNTGKGNDFVLKPHAERAFYESLSMWSIFLRSPAKYGFADNLKDLKAAKVIWDRIALTDEQKIAAVKYGSNGQMNLYGVNVGGICHRTKISQISKGFLYQNE